MQGMPSPTSASGGRPHIQHRRATCVTSVRSSWRLRPVQVNAQRLERIAIYGCVLKNSGAVETGFAESDADAMVLAEADR
jgi:hypothetical protein